MLKLCDLQNLRREGRRFRQFLQFQQDSPPRKGPERYIRSLQETPENGRHFDLIDGGNLTYVHGRALLICEDHTTRLHLARQAAAEGWSTRQLEDAARKAQAPTQKRSRTRNADQDAFVTRLGEAVATHTGLPIHVKPGPKDTYAFVVTGDEQARALAKALGANIDKL